MTMLISEVAEVVKTVQSSFIVTCNIPGYVGGEISECESIEEGKSEMRRILSDILDGEYAEEAVKITGSADEWFIKVVSDGEHDLGYVIEMSGGEPS